MIKRSLALSVGVGLGLWAAAASADIYRCVMPDGSTSYSDEKCDGEAAVSANITATLPICTTDQCRDEEARDRGEAIERLKQEKAALAQLEEARLRRQAQEADAEQREMQIKRLALLDAQLSAAQEASGGVYFPAYGQWQRCQPHCGGKGPGVHPHPRPRPSAPVAGVRIRF